ncbi:MAG: radical SAM protein [Oscillospiraceae bacterium]|nr:radical SAM protein [Oscillospiraceae bacterium]
MYSKVYVEITNICNMNCSFCHGHSRHARRMNEAEFACVLDKLDGQTKYIYYHLMGEPLSHPLLPDFIRMATERGFKSVITTNGTLLKKRGAELIAAAPHKVSVSLHSFEGDDRAEHERYLSETAEFAEVASKAGIIVVFRLWNKGYDGGKNDDVYEFLRSRIEGEWVENTRGIRIHDKLHLEWGDRFEWPDKEAPLQGDEVFCYGLRDHFGILCDGSVVPCCLDSDGEITLGNILEQSAEEILASPRAKAMVKGFECRTASEELCRRCGYAQRFV